MKYKATTDGAIPPVVFYDHKLLFSGAETCQKCVIPSQRSDRGNLIELRTGVSYRDRIWFTQYIEIATPPSAVRNDTCGAKSSLCAKLSFIAPAMYHAMASP